MEREMLQVKVHISGGHICISQEEFSLDERSVVIIHPDQVDLLVKWIQEAASELKG